MSKYTVTDNRGRWDAIEVVGETATFWIVPVKSTYAKSRKIAKRNTIGILVSKADAQWAVERLRSATAERDRRHMEARKAYDTKRTEILNGLTPIQLTGDP